MNLKLLASRRTFSCLCRVNGTLLSQSQRNFSSIAPSFVASLNGSAERKCHFRRVDVSWGRRCVHSAAQEAAGVSDAEDDQEGDNTTNEFLSRFVWLMRGKLKQAYPDSDKSTIDGMLLIIAEKVVDEINKKKIDATEKMSLGAVPSVPSDDFSEDLWKTVWEVSGKVLEDMEKERKKEKLKSFLQNDKVKEMVRFAGEVGIRGDLLRELRLKWASEEMEENDFYERLRLMREAAKETDNEGGEVAEENEEGAENRAETVELVRKEDKLNVSSLPRRRGKFKYNIYGLDLSDAKWAEVADKIHEANEVIWPQEPKPIEGVCKIATEKILSLELEDDPLPVLAEWKEVLQPSRVDWINLLDKLKEKSIPLYHKVAELLLSEDSFQASIGDYSKLIDAYAKEDQLEEAERVLKKMEENGISPDILVSTILVRMYLKGGNVKRANEVFATLRKQGFQPNMRSYTSMIMALVKGGDSKSAEALIRDMEAIDLIPTEEIYMSLLRYFAKVGNATGAARIKTAMQFAGFQASAESCTLLVEAYGKAGDPDQARNNFDYMIKSGYQPNDSSVASMISAYEKKNFLDNALNLLLVLQKEHGFEPGVGTYTVLVDWLGKLQMIDEAEQALGKIAELGEAPPLKIHVSLCDMYLRAGVEKKALQALGVLEARKDELADEDFERIIKELVKGGFHHDAQRMLEFMKARGFTPSEELQATIMGSQRNTFKWKRPSSTRR